MFQLLTTQSCNLAWNGKVAVDVEGTLKLNKYYDKVTRTRSLTGKGVMEAGDDRKRSF